MSANAYMNKTVMALAAGTAYTLTNTQALITMGTTSPTISLPFAGRWLVEGQADIQNNGATFAANRTLTVKLRDTTNSADLTGGSSALFSGIITTLTSQFGTPYVMSEITVTGATTVQLWGAFDTAPTAGTTTVVATGTWIRATYLGSS